MFKRCRKYLGDCLKGLRSPKPTLYTTYCRYGAQSLYTDDDDPERVARGLIAELRTEEFDEPDDEHAEVSISWDDWSISANVFGRVTLQDLSWITGNETDDPENATQMVESVYMRDVPDSVLIGLMVDLARGNIDDVRSRNWLALEQLPPFKRAFYRGK